MLEEMIRNSTAYYDIVARREWDPLPVETPEVLDDEKEVEEAIDESTASPMSPVYPSPMMSPPASESGYESSNSRCGPTCHICSQQFTRPDDRDRHIRERHKKEGKVTCQFCGAVVTKRLLNRHLERTQKCLRRRELSMGVHR